jgi:hypothetical protein
MGPPEILGRCGLSTERRVKLARTPGDRDLRDHQLRSHNRLTREAELRTRRYGAELRNEVSGLPPSQRLIHQHMLLFVESPI